ncbi:MAG: toll/interleukin-1 receptor domain-containing protein, partial [Hyphomicrobiales bacterium]|nr:toll/interleukin-1 receptor domain-containing protein [Hyphomicrobiales bacterium]
MDQPSPFIFLSHSGADTTAARELKRRLLESPDAHVAGLEVWFDKDDLRPGGQWQPQIEQAIASASSFVVYVGSKGVMNWVEAEVRVALSRANTNKDFLFIPALAADSAGSSALPSFAKLYQGVRDPLSDGGELAKLLKAVLKSDWSKAPKLI